MDIYEYDLEADAFVLSREKYNYTYSIEVTSELIVDIDSNKNLVAIELLDASKVLNVNPELLIKPKKIFAQIISHDNSINLTMKFEFKDTIREIDTPISEIISSSDALRVNA